MTLGYADDEPPAIDGASVSIPKEAVTALIGPNGSGKSTLLKGLSNQLAPERGVVELDGRDVKTLGTKELARKLGLLSQENTSPRSLTVADLAMHGRYPHRRPFESRTSEDEAAVERALSLAGVEHLRERAVGSLSGGQKQLAWIAMVLAQDTDILLLDEPTTFLNLHHQLEMMGVVKRLNAEDGVTVLIVLHDVNQAARYADHLLALADGTIHVRGSPEAVLSEELLADVFGINASVDHRDGTFQVILHRAVHDADGTARR